MLNKFKILWVSFMLLSLTGCSGIAKGITEAVLKQKVEDTRQCEVTGPSFPGVMRSLEAQSDAPSSKTTKILVVHGISKHLPGYSTRFKQSLMQSMELELASDSYKEIKIRHPDFEGKDGTSENLGVLRVARHQNLERTKDVLFYELTWSQITDPDKAELEFDNSGEYTFRRVDINALLKEFMNETVPDLMVYRGLSKEKIGHSVGQAVCWVFAGDWDDLEKEQEQFCDSKKYDLAHHIIEDDYFFVTHSLGSLITVEALSNATSLHKQNVAKDVVEALKQKEFQVYMLSNQLPLLQLGVPKPEVSDQYEQYCMPDGEKFDQRVFKKINLIAFSDPNDILSYPIPPRYGERNIDSRLCPDIVNVNVNVTQVKEVLGVGFANPLDAHGGYWEDDRVLELIKEGIARKSQSELIRKRCDWTETIN